MTEVTTIHPGHSASTARPEANQMLRSCKYCGKIHDTKFNCGKRPVQIRNSAIDKFRHAGAWEKKSLEIRERDHFLCQACIRNLPGTIRKLNYDNLSVHHAVPICKNWDARLDNNNLITLCSVHHEMAESGQITLKTIRSIIDEQNSRIDPPGGCHRGIK